VAAYFSGMDETSFYSDIQIAFVVLDETEHYHVPLLLNPFGYSTYRGS
jgi:5-hydroxyisourate hydrolase